MNLQQFSALKVGDKIETSMMGFGDPHRGTVSSVSDSGVRVRWGTSTMEFFYSVNSTAWMHWSHATGVANERWNETMAVPARECSAEPCYREDCRQSDQCLGGDYNKIGGKDG